MISRIFPVTEEIFLSSSRARVQQPSCVGPRREVLQSRFDVGEISIHQQEKVPYVLPSLTVT